MTTSARRRREEHMTNSEQLQRIGSGQGFVCRLDQSGGSTR